MADNIVKLLGQIQETASASEVKQFGVEIGLVTNVQDPEKLGRVKVCFPRLPDKPESSWCRVAQPAAGAGRGFYFVPQVNDEVLIAFERGEANQPYVIGSLWNGQDKPMDGAYTDDNTKSVIQTKSGHRVELDDKDGEEKIVIADKSGKRTHTFDVKKKKFLIEAKEGDIEIHAEKKLVLSCEDLEIRTDKSAKLHVGSNLDVKVDAKANIKADSQLNLKASRVNIN